MGQWIVGVTSFQKIYALYSVKHQKVEKWSYYASCGWILWVGWVCVGDKGVGSGSVDSGCHQISENIWFVWSKHPSESFKWSFSGKVGVMTDTHSPFRLIDSAHP